jgi:hypothetical protein
MPAYNIRRVISDTFDSFRNMQISHIPSKGVSVRQNPFFMSSDIALYMAVSISARNYGTIQKNGRVEYDESLARSFNKTAHFLITSRYSVYHAEGAARTTPAIDQWENLSNHDSAWRGSIDGVLLDLCLKARAHCENHMPPEMGYRTEVDFKFEMSDLSIFKFYQLQTTRRGEERYYKEITSMKPLDFSFKLTPAKVSENSSQ